MWLYVYFGLVPVSNIYSFTDSVICLSKSFCYLITTPTFFPTVVTVLPERLITLSNKFLALFGRYTTAKQEYYRILAINEGDALEISCLIKDPIKFLYPSGSDLGHSQV